VIENKVVLYLLWITVLFGLGYFAGGYLRRVIDASGLFV
jgi:hypothetical protein